MPIKATEWHQIDKVFSELLDLDPNKRTTRLAEISITNAAMGRRLNRLLGHMERENGLEGLAKELSEVTVNSDLKTGEMIGSWRIVRKIGGGGMADVYEAERRLVNGNQKAAVKILSVALSTGAARSNFEREISILARLEDPRLSRLIDVGNHKDGRPWLAMEYVEGSALDKAFDQRQLTVKQRVEIFVEIIKTVDHAHRELIVHRDLKPSNILLDQNGRPRILDFGIATLLEPGSREKDLTRTSSQAYTLTFTSPEQLQGHRTGIPGDVYQLGLLLYLLLVGKRAFSGRDENPFQLINAMQRGPELPSQRVRRLNESEVKKLSTSQSQLHRKIKGDLDSIIVQALEFNPQKRYRGASDFADDLQRWLDGKPVQARSATLFYRSNRFIRRHWIGASSSLVIALFASAYVGMIFNQKIELEAERNRTQSVLDAMTEMFSVADPYEANADQITVQSVVNRTADELIQSETMDPEAQVQLMLSLATILASGRDHSKEAELLFHALDIAQVHDLDEALQDDLRINYLSTLASNGQLNDAYHALTEALPRIRGDALYQGRLLEGQLLSALGNRELAVEKLKALVQELPNQTAYASQHANAHNSLGLALSRLGKLEEALEHYSKALDSAPSDLASDQDLIAIIRTNSAVTLVRLLRYEEAELAFRENIEWRVKTLGVDHPSVSVAARTFAPLLYRTLRYQSARELAERYPFRGSEYHRALYVLTFARAQFYTGESWTALDDWIESLELTKSLEGAESILYLDYMDQLAFLLAELGAVDSALAVAQWRLQESRLARFPVHSAMISLLLTNDAIPAETRTRYLTGLAQDACANTEFEILEMALAGERELDKIQFPDQCHSDRAGRMLQLGVEWSPPWKSAVQMEPFTSPLISRLQNGTFDESIMLSEERSERVRRLISNH